VNYDLRKRDSDIEKNRQSAMEATHKIKQAWSEFDVSVYDQPIEINGTLSHKSDESMKLQTTIGREVAYSIAHAQHHYAIIGVMCALLEHKVDEQFGVAPSTAAHMKKQGEKSLAAK
jgi:hypothetical protein